MNAVWTTLGPCAAAAAAPIVFLGEVSTPEAPSTSFALPVVELGSISGLLLGGPIVEVGEVVSMASPLGDSSAAMAEGRIGICLDLELVSCGALKLSRGACSTIVLNISTTEYR